MQERIEIGEIAETNQRQMADGPPNSTDRYFRIAASIRRGARVRHIRLVTKET
jgi:hypothetical protein